jgi:hypothetical protein
MLEQPNLDTSHELPQWSDSPELPGAPLMPEIPAPALPKKLMISTRGHVWELVEAPNAEFDGVGGA